MHSMSVESLVMAGDVGHSKPNKARRPLVHVFLTVLYINPNVVGEQQLLEAVRDMGI
jgi:hypothetical protein